MMAARDAGRAPGRAEIAARRARMGEVNLGARISAEAARAASAAGHAPGCRAWLQAAAEAEALALLAAREKKRRALVEPVWIEACWQASQLMHVDCEAILAAKTATRKAGPLLMKPALLAREIALFIAHLAGMEARDASLMSGLTPTQVRAAVAEVAGAAEIGRGLRAELEEAARAVATTDAWAKLREAGP